MSTATAALLGRLNKTLGNYGKKEKGASKDEKDKLKFKFKKGNNHLLFLTPPGAADPFVEWGYHKSLQEVDWYTQPCDELNKGENCVICNTVSELKKSDFKGNMHIWKPIEQQIESWAWVVDVESAESIAKGPQWAKISKTVMGVIVNWLENLEAGEVPFYDMGEPMKLIISYNPDEQPAKKYNCDKKYVKAYADTQIEEWMSKYVAFTEVVFAKSNANLKKLLEDYLYRTEEMVSSGDEKEEDSAEKPQKKEVSEVVKSSTSSRLEGLKKNS